MVGITILLGGKFYNPQSCPSRELKINSYMDFISNALNDNLNNLSGNCANVYFILILSLVTIMVQVVARITNYVNYIDRLTKVLLP